MGSPRAEARPVPGPISGVLPGFRGDCRKSGSVHWWKMMSTRRVRVVESTRLASPIAFGLLKPTVGLPRDFRVRFNEEKRDVMLAHELAHLRRHDHSASRQTQNQVSLDPLLPQIVSKPPARIFARCEHHNNFITRLSEEINRDN